MTCSKILNLNLFYKVMIKRKSRKPCYKGARPFENPRIVKQDLLGEKTNRYFYNCRTHKNNNIFDDREMTIHRKVRKGERAGVMAKHW